MFFFFFRCFTSTRVVPAICCSDPEQPILGGDSCEQPHAIALRIASTSVPPTLTTSSNPNTSPTCLFLSLLDTTWPTLGQYPPRQFPFPGTGKLYFSNRHCRSGIDSPNLAMDQSRGHMSCHWPAAALLDDWQRSQYCSWHCSPWPRACLCLLQPTSLPTATVD